MIEQYEGFKAAEQADISASKSSTYRDKFVHVEYIEDNFYQLHITDYQITGDADIACCYRNGVWQMEDDITEDQMQEQECPDSDCLPWSDDDCY